MRTKYLGKVKNPCKTIGQDYRVDPGAADSARQQHYNLLTPRLKETLLRENGEQHIILCPYVSRLISWLFTSLLFEKICLSILVSKHAESRARACYQVQYRE